VLNTLQSFLSFLMSAAVVGAVTPTTRTQQLLGNPQAAFNDESNAGACYLSFAKKADEEGFGKVASLFRAAAMAEETHASNHAEVIRQMGAVPVAQIETMIVESTRVNLRLRSRGDLRTRRHACRIHRDGKAGGGDGGHSLASRLP